MSSTESIDHGPRTSSHHGIRSVQNSGLAMSDLSATPGPSDSGACRLTTCVANLGPGAMLNRAASLPTTRIVLDLIRTCSSALTRLAPELETFTPLLLATHSIPRQPPIPRLRSTYLLMLLLATPRHVTGRAGVGVVDSVPLLLQATCSGNPSLRRRRASRGDKKTCVTTSTTAYTILEI